MRLKSNLAADGALALTTLIWGSTFFMAKEILNTWPPVAYLVFRFALAAGLMALALRRQVGGAGRAEWRAGVVLGLLVGGGFALQAAGQVYTTASKSAFVTGLTTPLVPFIAYAVLRVRPSLENLIGVALASLGGALILTPQGGETGVNVGDLLTLAATGLFALHITQLSVYARRFDVRQVAVLQIVVAAACLSLTWGTFRAAADLFGIELVPAFVARESATLVWDASIVWQLVYLAVVGTLLTFLLWTWGQSRTSPTHAAIIFSLEPVFATAFAVAALGAGEWLGGRGLVGAALVFAGIIVSEVRLGRVQRRAAESPRRDVEAG
ncbi:MAG: DMT family transporter [Pyrinomonadaceae bacterium]